MITVDQQLSRVLEVIRPLQRTEELPLSAARGRVLAVPVLAASDIPVFDNSAMDGYAVRHADVAAATSGNIVKLRVVADLPAGSPLDPRIAPGEAARIMTGAPMPSDADTIVPVESTDVHSLSDGPADATGSLVGILGAPAAGAHVRRAGGDLGAGDTVVPTGTVLAARHLSAAAAAGVPTVTVAASPRVAVVATGSELVDPGSPLERGQIPESNTVLLTGLLAEAGADVVEVRRIADDADALRHWIDGVTGVDLVVFTGGVSVGAYDVVKEVLQSIGDVEFSSVAMQPGKPQAFGTLPSGVPVFGLPGNPVSVAVSFEVFVRPAIVAMTGAVDASSRLRARVATGWRTPPSRRQYMPVRIERSGVIATVSPATTGGSGSHLAGGLAAADGYAIVETEVETVSPGDELDVIVLR